MTLAKKVIEMHEATDYDKFTKELDALNKSVEDAEKELKAVTGDTNGGLVPDDIKSSKEYKKADQKFKIVFKSLQNFNKDKANKAFFKKRSTDRRASWSKK